MSLPNVVVDEELRKKPVGPFSKQSNTRARAEALLLLLLRLPAGEDHSGVAVRGFRSRRVPAAGTDSLQRFRFQLRQRGLSESHTSAVVVDRSETGIMTIWTIRLR